jgi:transcriptional regulator with XRE-family HTH domain
MSNEEVMHMTLGERLKAQRLRCGYTQCQLAAEAKVSQGLIARIERSQVHNPSSDVLRRIARVLRCSIDWLVGLYDDDPADASLCVPVGVSP